MQESCEWVHFLRPALRRELIMSKVINVVHLPVIRAYVSLHMTPCTFYCVCVGASALVNEPYSIVDGVVCVTLRVEIAVRTPTITDDRSAGFDPCIYDGHQSFGSSVTNGNEKRFTRLALNATKQPLPLKGVAPAVFALCELALNGHVRTADLLRAALHAHEHGLSAELAPLRECSRIEAMLVFDKGGRFAAHDVICEKHNLRESEVSMLKPRTVLDRFGLRAHDNRPSPTSPPKTVAFRASAPGHIATASITRHLATNQARGFQKLDTKIHVAEKLREK